MVNINLIVAMCKNNGIGLKGKIPWTIESDMRYFSKITKGDGLNAVIMGRNTWDSLPLIKGKHGLIGRHNFVLSTTLSFDNNEDNSSHRMKTFKNIKEILNFLNENDDLYEDVWVIGGEQIYKEFLDMNIINRCYVTYIDKIFNCDTFFPLLVTNEWKEIKRNDTYNVSNTCDVNYVVYERYNNEMGT